MGKYCCFVCPSEDQTEKQISDRCPTCGRAYDFAATHQPTKVREFTLRDSLGRGFYGAAYTATSGFVDKLSVIKIVPTLFYEHFKKPSFYSEVQMHSELAKHAAHVVGVSDAFEETITFEGENSVTLPCYVTVLEYVPGQLLRGYTELSPKVASVCQIAIDLLKLVEELAASQVHHNDLHAENLIVEHLRPEMRRANAIDGTIKVVAIDLGSVADGSKSTLTRDGDLRFIASHIDALLTKLLSNPSDLDDRDYRVALALQSVINTLQAEVHKARIPNPEDLIRHITEAYYRSPQQWQPWNAPLSLKSFSDHYNAQTLESWNVSKLVVDPGDRWRLEITKPGPQIVTGMRGCGKTMILRSLDFHARASRRGTEEARQTMDRLASDDFVGLFVSAQRLLDLREEPLMNLERRLTRLFVAYSLQATRALLHLRDVHSDAVNPISHQILASAVASFISGAESLEATYSLDDLETRLERLAVQTVRGSTNVKTSQAPAEIFTHLASQFRQCSSTFHNKTVFFLLDDVSTRYLELEKIETLLSALLFQSPLCAFKFTSEWQTIELGLRSPGRIHPIRVDRDLTIFDLGADVYDKINTLGDNGKEFVSSILKQRANWTTSNRFPEPREVLGDVSLEQVAREIASSNESSRKKKGVYRGLTCLANVCVGDIGDVIKLYEEILEKAESSSLPVKSETQSRCFSEMCSRRLYDLNRRANYFKNHALAFAEAAHDLLVRSFKKSPSRRKVASNRPSIPEKRSTSPRIRQYSLLYVRVTSDDEEAIRHQIDQLRDLIDAGVFVFAGGSPRSKTKDSNPIQQFVLAYRKIYGLTSFIGLADRDRFELSGSDLSNWLNSIADVKKILLRNQTSESFDNNTVTQEDESPDPEEVASVVAPATPSKQGLLFDSPPKVEGPSALPATRIQLACSILNQANLPNIPIDTVFSGLGFEERTLCSNEILAGNLSPARVYLLQYEYEGFGPQILELWQSRCKGLGIIDYRTLFNNLPPFSGNAMVDISGLTKPTIFAAIRRELSDKGSVFVAYQTAEQYYPLDDDLVPLLAAEAADDPAALLEGLSLILTGEQGPYTAHKLLPDTADPTRKRALIAFASAKHERLFSLLDRREYDQIEVITARGNNPRASVSRYAAKYACTNYNNTKLVEIVENDPRTLFEHLDERYLELVSNGFSVEVGITGSKLQTLAAAALAAARKVAQVWYLAPKNFDQKRFSKGAKSFQVFELSMSVG